MLLSVESSLLLGMWRIYCRETAFSCYTTSGKKYIAYVEGVKTLLCYAVVLSEKRAAKSVGG